jgi:hypothetical protein
MVTSSSSHFFFVEKWIPPSRSETVEIDKKTEGILGVEFDETHINGKHRLQVLQIPLLQVHLY